jgi:DNA adenine methylase
MRSNSIDACAPLLRWAGSKRATAGALAQYWRNDFRKYIEPFCGSAALFFKISPQQAVLGDINLDLIAFYETISSNASQVYQIFSSFPRERDTYYRLRDDYRTMTDPTLRAAIFYYLNKNCFNGLYRTNKQGHFNVPFSDNRVGQYPSKTEFLNSCEQIARATLVRGDFFKVVRSLVRRGDFVYLDPPYASSARLPFREYYPDSFSVHDIERLAALLDHIDRVGANFILTYSDDLVIRSIAKQWGSKKFKVRRNISGFSDSRRMATEQVITNIGII